MNYIGMDVHKRFTYAVVKDDKGRWFAMTKLEGAPLETNMGSFMDALDLRVNHKNPALSLTREQAAQAKGDIFAGFLELEQRLRKNNLYDLDWKNGENILIRVVKNSDGTISTKVERIDFGMTVYGKEQLLENQYETVVRDAIDIHFKGHVEIPESVLNVDYFKS